MSARLFVALGTASQVPTRERNHNGYFIRWDNEGFLLDPGEGTQRQMIFAGISASQITKIFITHFHGDHCLGLAGILQRISLDKVAHEVEIYYPEYGEKYVSNLRNSSVYFNTAKIVEKPFSLSGEIFRSKNFFIKTEKLNHTLESWGYAFIEEDSVTMLPEKLAEFGVKGRDIARLKAEGKIVINGKTVDVESVSVEKEGLKVAFVMDTKICGGAFNLAKDADYLICESTYLESEIEDAIKNGHLTAKQAAKIAADSNVENLILTHFSQRYISIENFAKEASEIHKKVFAVSDGEQIPLTKLKNG